MLWGLKNNKNATETCQKISSVENQSVITDRQIRNWF